MIVVLGPDTIGAMAGRRKPFAIFMKMTGAQCSLAFINPLYNAAFVLLSPTQQSFFVIFLPAMKLAIKNVVAQISSDAEDRVPELALFTVEVFNALYMVTCMQNAGSFVTTVVIICFDALSASLALRNIYKTTVVVDNLARAELGIRRTTLLPIEQRLCRGSTMLQLGLVPKLRLRTVSRLRLVRSNSELLEALASVGLAGSVQSTQATSASRRHSSSFTRLSSLRAPRVRRASSPNLVRVTPMSPITPSTTCC